MITIGGVRGGGKNFHFFYYVISARPLGGTTFFNLFQNNPLHKIKNIITLKIIIQGGRGGAGSLEVCFS